MKGGISAAKELCDFLRERAKLEEENCKAQTKLATKLTPSTLGTTCGTFTPMLLAFKVSAEKLSGIHNQWSLKLNELVREVIKYTEDQHKKHKHVKDDVSPTLEAVKTIQDTTVLLHKAKETYKQRCLEVEKLKRDGASTKDLEKAEAKFRKAQDDYKSLVDKYCQVRDEFERKMTLAAKHFQDVESGHLKQMREFIESYCQIVDNNNNLLGRVSIYTSLIKVTYCNCKFFFFFYEIIAGLSRIPDTIDRLVGGEFAGTIHTCQAHGTGETRSVGTFHF
jgi:hypothetical protein